MSNLNKPDNRTEPDKMQIVRHCPVFGRAEPDRTGQKPVKALSLSGPCASCPVRRVSPEKICGGFRRGCPRRRPTGWAYLQKAARCAGSVGSGMVQRRSGLRVGYARADLEPVAERMDVSQNPAATPVRSRGDPRRSRPEKRRYGGRSHQTARVRTLVAGFRVQLGAASNDSIMTAAITRAAELTMLAEMRRAAAIRGEGVDLGDLIRLEGAARRAVADLRLPAVERSDVGYVPLRERWAREVEGEDVADGVVSTPIAASPDERISGLIDSLSGSFAEQIQWDVPRMWERSVKTFLRHHSPRAVAYDPITLIDPHLNLHFNFRRAHAVPFKCCKPAENIASHYRPAGLVQFR